MREREPWSLLKTRLPGVRYVVVSEDRHQDLLALWGDLTPPAPLSCAERGEAGRGGRDSDIERVRIEEGGRLDVAPDRVVSWKPAPTEPGVGAGFQQPIPASPRP